MDTQDHDNERSLQLPHVPSLEKLPPGSPEAIHINPGPLKPPSTPSPKASPKGGAKAKRVEDEEETEENATFLLLLDVVPAFVIFLSAIVAGLSADIEPDHEVWRILEIVFTTFFIGEIVVKVRYFGWRVFLCGPDWYWSWFDIACVVLAIVDMSLTYISIAAGNGNANTGPISSLKSLKLARLGRIIRLLKFKIFQELKLMIQGVFTGLRVLFWAVVLLIISMYLLGVITKTIFADFHEEFSTVPAAMFTWFRCFTDGCSAYDGTPLQEKVRKEFGGIFMLAYILLFLFVTIGIFNLIMAVFIDNVADGSTKKRQRQLGQNAAKTEWMIASVLRRIILTKILRKDLEEQMAEGHGDMHESEGRRVSKLLDQQILSLQEMYGFKPHTGQEYEQLTDQIREQMAERNVVVTKDEFNHWLSTDKELISRLDESEIDLSCKSDLFDVLDADLSGELEFEEMIDGLLKCRGPASKTDIIAVRLKTAFIVRMLLKVCEKLGIEDP
ncbi:CACNA1F [Symbiodinium natans]|uniref:CACNA1F protein n=1 Tax=Symbiodinium natans TaxID=878477 RepID=A0A812U7V3_9DINO|nr:CACNA1F [Symbiodinium natans]